MSDALVDKMMPVAAALAIAVDEEDADTIDTLLTTLSKQQLYGLAVVLAAHVDPDKPFIRTTVAGATKRAVRKAAAVFDVDSADVFSQDRTHEVLRARVVSYYVAHLLGDSYSQIGRVMNRDHSSVMSGVARVGADPKLRHVARAIATDLGWEREGETA